MLTLCDLKCNFILYHSNRVTITSKIAHYNGLCIFSSKYYDYLFINYFAKNTQSIINKSLQTNNEYSTIKY